MYLQESNLINANHSTCSLSRLATSVLPRHLLQQGCFKSTCGIRPWPAPQARSCPSLRLVSAKASSGPAQTMQRWVDQTSIALIIQKARNRFCVAGSNCIAVTVLPS
jgi:hypothetical protein